MCASNSKKMDDNSCFPPSVSSACHVSKQSSIRKFHKLKKHHAAEEMDGNNNISEGMERSTVSKKYLLQEARTFIRMRSPEKEMPHPPILECICNRKIMGILCRSCGDMFRGRVRKICPFHPTSRYLMDYEVCPSCKATQLQEFEETVTDMDCEKERNV